MDKINVVSYIRVSTLAQGDEDRYGVDVQKEDIEKYCNANNMNIIDEYSDIGVSGAKLVRPALDELLKRADTQEFKFVVVSKLDRLARDLFLQLFIEKELLKFDIEIMSVAEPMRGSDPAGQLFRTMISAFAQFERGRITERLSAGRIHKAKEGRYAGGGIPMGYVHDVTNKSLSVNLDKVNTVRRIFELREANTPYKVIAEQLNLEGLTTKEDKQFSAMQVKRVVDRRELYEGIYNYAGVSVAGKHEAII